MWCIQNNGNVLTKHFFAGLVRTEERSATENDCIANKLSPVEYREEEVTNCLKFWQGLATTSCKNLVHSILYGNFSTKGTRCGIANKPVAKRKMADEHGIVAIECGLFVDSEYPFFGATPDSYIFLRTTFLNFNNGLVGEDAIMEVKRLLSADKYGSPKEAVDNVQVNMFSHTCVTYSTFVLPGKIISYCAIVNGKPLLRRDSNYYKVQGKLHITCRKYGYFVVYLPVG
ncbi:hypothetical protein PR048_021811 [Dryococelus australis]|uniref:YqaJ viral recombinase domain-containing protein n=1 Tax=Dryococelus australis TaxID=614101 RepID=A0ABQ9GZC1_9NEOP|nr:hypothetical protein PR048_021811 [Dryococelus australis]